MRSIDPIDRGRHVLFALLGGIARLTGVAKRIDRCEPCKSGFRGSRAANADVYGASWAEAAIPPHRNDDPESVIQGRPPRFQLPPFVHHGSSRLAAVAPRWTKRMEWEESGHSAYGNADLHSRPCAVPRFPEGMGNANGCEAGINSIILNDRCRGSSEERSLSRRSPGVPARCVHGPARTAGKG